MAEQQPSYVDPNADYYDRVHRVTWLRRTAGIFTGATMGGAYGAIIGAALSFMPYILGSLKVAGAVAAGATVALPELAFIGATMALVAGFGAFLGITVATDVGATAGAVSAGLEEQDRRLKGELLQKNAAPLGKTGQSKDPNGPTNKLEPEQKPYVKWFNWKVAPITGLLLAAFGAMIALNPLTAGGVVSTLGVSGIAAVITSAVGLGMFGGLMGFTNSRISNHISNFYTKLLSGKYFDRAPEPVAAAPTQSPAKEPAENFVTANERTTSFRKMVAERDANATAAEISLSGR